MTELKGRKEERKGRREEGWIHKWEPISTLKARTVSSEWCFCSLGDIMPGYGLWSLSIFTFAWGKEAWT